MCESETIDRDLVQIKVVDFGFSTFILSGENLSLRIGTPLYLSPEIIKPSEGYNEKVDIWSIGVIAYYMLS